MSHPIKHILVVSASTLTSRVLGLVRDSIIFSFLGTSPLNAAFLMAFTLPNLFRRLLGEGALTSALVPVLAETLETGGKPLAHTFLNAVLTRITLLLIALCILGIGALAALPLIPNLPERWYLAAVIGQWLMPYMPCVCLAAIFSAALNVHHRFAMAALAPICLNLAMASSLIICGNLWATTPWQMVAYLSGGVLVGGLFQLALPLFALRQIGWAPAIHFEKSPYLQELTQLFLPSVTGAAIFQINILVSRLLAFSLDDASISLLYLGGRLIELPLGMFTLAVVTVIFPQLARLAAKKEGEGIARVYGQGLRLVMAITVPATVGLIVLASPILRVLFEWGAFEAKDVALAIPVLSLCSLGIPLYSWATLSTRGFHAFKDTRSPVKIAILAFITNTLLSLIFMKLWGVCGLALAGILSVLLQATCLHIGFWKKTHHLKSLHLFRPLLQIALASTLMGLWVYLGQRGLHTLLGEDKLSDLIILLALIPTGILLYGSTLWVIRFEDLQALRSLIFKFLGKA